MGQSAVLSLSVLEVEKVTDLLKMFNLKIFLPRLPEMA